MKGKEEASKKMLNEIEASQLSDIEFKTMVIRKLSELTENYQKLQGNYEEPTASYVKMKKARTHQRTTQQQTKHNYIQRTNINGIQGIPRVSKSGDQGDCTTESHRYLTTEVNITN